MTTLQNTITIRRPIDEVFAYLADLENIPVWNYAIDVTTKISDGPVGVGTRYRQSRSVPNRSVEELEVIAFEPAHRLVIEGELGPFQARLGYLLSETPGGTTLRNEVDLAAQALGPRLVTPLAVPRIKAAVAQNLLVLKRVLEAGRPG